MSKKDKNRLKMKGEKTGGRTKGTPNKVTLSIRESISTFLESETESVFDELSKLEGKEKIEMYLRLLKYVVSPAQAAPPSPKFPSIANMFVND